MSHRGKEIPFKNVKTLQDIFHMQLKLHIIISIAL